MMLVITKWNEIFENAGSRKRQRLNCLMIPAGNDSAGYVELMALGAEGVQAFGVFLAICQWSATRIPGDRGKLIRSNGSDLTLPALSRFIRMDESVVSEAIEILQRPEIGWISEEKTQSTADLPRPCRKEKQKQREKKKEEEKEKESCLEPTAVSELASPDPVVLEFPTKRKGHTFELRASKLAEWSDLYDGTADVWQEVRKARQWLIDNPARRKSERGMPKFLLGWIDRSTSRETQQTRGHPATFSEIKNQATIQAGLRFLDQKETSVMLE